ncbi:MAG: HEPN domain-containing protein [Bacteroidota bacterium]
MKQEDYTKRFTYAQGSLKVAQYSYKEELFCHAAFNFHQASENAITTLLLVYTGYKPKTHDLQILREKVQALEPSLAEWFDLSDPKDSHHFDLLKRAYIEARYSKSYVVRLAELQYIEERVVWFQGEIKTLCQQEITNSTV